MKKNLLIITFICFGILTTKAQEEETFDLTVEITGITTDAGKVFIAVYDKQENFLKDTEKSLKTNVVVENKKAIAKFKGLKKGEYAISIFPR